MTSLRLALRQFQVERGAGVAGFARRLDRMAGEAAQGGARLLLLPEYACVGLASGDGPPDVTRELATVCALTDDILLAMRQAAHRHGIWLAPGSLPMRAGPRVFNRAPLIAPDGAIAFQDKHVMTRFEAETWRINPGAPPAVFATPWGIIGISICYDIEFPALARAQVEAGAWLILVPTCTDTLHGFNRVRLAARARALENQCFVAIAPTVGLAPWSAALDENHGYAAVFGPVDRGFSEDGVIARGTLDQDQCVFADLDPALLAAVRAEGAVRNHRDWPEPPPHCRILTPA